MKQDDCLRTGDDLGIVRDFYGRQWEEFRSPRSSRTRTVSVEKTQEVPGSSPVAEPAPDL